MPKIDRKLIIEIALIFFTFSYIEGIRKAFSWGLTLDILSRFSFTEHLMLIGLGMYHTFIVMSIVFMLRTYLKDDPETRDPKRK